MDSGDIRSRLQELQSRQHQKMKEIMKSKSQEKMSENVRPSDSFSFGLGDDLQLTTANVSTSSIEGLHTALEDANTRMREEVRELKDETGRLRKQLAEKEYEIRRLNKTVSKMEDDKKLLANAGAQSDTAAVKIVDLSKRNRELTAEMETEKTKSLKLLKRIAELERASPVHGQAPVSPRKKASPRDSLALHPGIAMMLLTPDANQHLSNLTEPPVTNVNELQDKLQAVNMKLAEYRNQIQELKLELKVAHKVLQQETGESVASMQLLLSSGGIGFRGRSQQITALHDKVKDLEHKLRVSFGHASYTKPDKNQERIKNMERQRKEQIEELRIDISRASEHGSDLQRKLDATKARNKVLLNENKSLKSQISVLTAKGAHDNELIMTLMRQQENLQRLVHHNMLVKERAEQSGVMLSKEVNSKQQQENAELSRLRQLLTERDARLRELEEMNQNLKQTFHSKKTTPSPVDRKGDSDTPFQQIEELRVEVSKYQALYNAALIQEQKHQEIQSVLNKRIDHATALSQDLNRSLNEERRKCAKLESALESSKQAAGQYEASSSAGKSQVPSQAQITELETLLSIQTDENGALKESLQSTLRAKAEDASLFHEMMEQTKTVFMDALRNLSSRKT